MSKVSCRKAFTERLTELARTDKQIVAIATDSRGSVTLGGFAKEHPDRFIECGIAEQNAVGIAAGLSKSGKCVFVTGPACFLAARAFEQIKIDVAYNKTNVKIIGVSSGVSYGPLGGTHTSTHDLASMRALPNIIVLAPSDNVQTAALTEHMSLASGPVYMRMGRGDVEGIYSEGETFIIGRAKTVREGSDITIIACGETVWHALQAAGRLAERGVSARVLDMFTIKPLDLDAVRRAVRETKAIITVEEHSEFGGLGEAVAHIVATSTAGVPMRIIGFPDEELLVGKSDELFAHYGLSADHIVQVAGELLEVK
jgi:transketolase